MSTNAFPNQLNFYSQRLVNSLQKCKSCVFLNQHLHPLSQNHFELKKTLNPMQKNFSELINEFAEIESLYKLLTICASSDQINAFLKIFNFLCSKNKNFLCYLTSNRGRGKSAVLGLSLAISVALG